MESHHNNFKAELEVCVVENPIIRQPAQDLDISSWNIPTNIILADENFYRSSNVDLIIGSEIFLKILSSGFTELGPNLPQLQNTVFGWIVMGKIDIITNELPFLGMVYGNKSIQLIPAEQNENDSLNEDVNMWYYEPTDLHDEENRRETIINWPLNNINPQKMAKSGFYYKGPPGTNVKCHFCKVEIENWKKGDDEVYKHLRWSSQCPLLLRQKTKNIPKNDSELEEILPTKNENSILHGIVIEKPDFMMEHHHSIVSKENALDHFLRMEFQLLRNPELKVKYAKRINKYIKQSILKEIDISKNKNLQGFMQHYPDSTTEPFSIKFVNYNDKT